MNNDKKYYWLKFPENFFDQPRIKKLRRLAGGDVYAIILIKTMLLTMNNDGIYEYKGLEDTLAKELELILNEDEVHIQAVLIFMEKTKMIEEINGNHFFIIDVPKMVGSETATAGRMRKSREKKKQLECNIVTPQLQNVPNCYTEKEKRREEKKEEKIFNKISSSKKDERDFFDFIERIRKEYQGNGYKEFYPVFFQLDDELVSVDAKGHLYIKSKDTLSLSRAQELWKYIFKYQSEIIPIEPQIKTWELKHNAKFYQNEVQNDI